MTDERLDQILKQALAPEIADTEIAVKQAGRNYYMKKLWKIGVAAVACAALLVAGTIAAGHQTVQRNREQSAFPKIRLSSVHRRRN